MLIEFKKKTEEVHDEKNVGRCKENYTADKKFVSLTVMYKLAGYNPAGGNWFWAKYGPDGKTIASGKVDACLKCHGEKKDNDFIWTGEVKK